MNPHPMTASKAGNYYPVIPSTYPSRAVRRAIRYRRDDRLPPGWLQLLALRPQLRAEIRRGA
jgi:hypothetical protein